MDPSKVANYVSERGALAYRADHANKLHRRISSRFERRIYRRLFADIGRSRTVLDLPCGAGRLFPLLRENADEIIEADFSPTMLSVNADDHARAAAAYIRCSALAIPFADRSIDTVVSIRLNHHFDDPDHRARHLREVFRVARRAAIVSYFSHTSLKNLLRRLRAPFTGKRPKSTLRTSSVAELAAASGFEAVRFEPLSRIGSGHVFGLFRRVT